MIFKHDTITSVKRLFSNPLKLCDMFYIRTAIFIRKFGNSLILLKQKKKINKIKSKIFPIAVWTNAYLLHAACSESSNNVG
jgi:glycine/serine hydroxymethyltransferase